MNPLLVAPRLSFGQDIIGRLFPDKEEARKAEADFLRLAMDGELKQVIAQLQINAQEAAHPSLWVAGWRPYYGWAGGTGFLYAVLLGTGWLIIHLIQKLFSSLSRLSGKMFHLINTKRMGKFMK